MATREIVVLNEDSNRLETLQSGDQAKLGDSVLFLSPINIIGTPGAQGFGVGICPPDLVPLEMSSMAGCYNRGNDNYGNYQYQDGSIMVWIPAFYYKIGTGANGLVVNVIDIKPYSAYANTTVANSDNYALHRAFIDGGNEQDGFFVDKYQWSQNAWGTGQIASSIKNGNPISTNSAHNPIANLTAVAGNYHYEVFTASHARDGVDGAINASSDFAPVSRFIWSALAILQIAHGQAASSSTHCAWYDATYNYPKGNNNSLADIDEPGITWVTDGYSGAGKTGSASTFAKSAHNGQNCGVVDLNGNMWEISCGLTRPGATSTDTAQQNNTADFYVLKEGVAIKDLDGGWSNVASGNEAFGDAVHLATLYDQITIGHIGNGTGWEKFGSGANQVLHEAVSGDNYKFTSLAIPKDANAEDATGTNLFGKDGIYEYHRANLCVLSGGSWGTTTSAGLWTVHLNSYRTNTYSAVGCRSCLYVKRVSE